MCIRDRSCIVGKPIGGFLHIHLVGKHKLRVFAPEVFSKLLGKGDIASRIQGALTQVAAAAQIGFRRKGIGKKMCIRDSAGAYTKSLFFRC